MTDEELKKAGLEAELCSEQDWRGATIVAARWQEDVDLLPYLRRFAEAVQAAERERCAKLCEYVASSLESAEEDAQAMSIGAQSCADQIRALA